MNLARLFSYTRLIERELRRERVLRRRDGLRHERERRKLIDGMQKAANKQPVFEQSQPTKQSNISPVAFGPTMSARRQEEKRKEIIERAESVKASNGHKVDAPEIPPE